MRDAFENKTETITFTVEEATMNRLREAFEDVNINECPFFDVQDRYGNAARYYRENARRMIFEKMTDAEFEKWLYEHGICHPDINESIACKVVPLLIDDAINELPPAKPSEEQEIKRLRELAARILGKYEEEKRKQLAAVRLASLRGSERDRAKELQARTVREIENLRKEIKGE